MERLTLGRAHGYVYAGPLERQQVLQYCDRCGHLDRVAHADLHRISVQRGACPRVPWRWRWRNLWMRYGYTSPLTGEFVGLGAMPPWEGEVPPWVKPETSVVEA